MLLDKFKRKMELDWLHSGQVFELENHLNQRDSKLYYKVDGHGEEYDLSSEKFDFTDYLEEFNHMYEENFADLRPKCEKREWIVDFKSERITLVIENHIDEENPSAPVNQIIYYTKD